jgi:SAM-dependent methyltransferase
MTPVPIRSRLSAARQYLRENFPRFGSLRRVFPVDPAFGLGKGTPIDRYYIGRFLDSRRETIRGRVVEIGDRRYTSEFGSAVTSSDVLHFVAGSPEATIVADISDCPQVESDSFDCVIITQTLHYIFDMPKAVAEIHRILAPGGHVLCTVPGISQVSRYDMDRWGDRWRLTSLSAAELFATAFAPEDVDVLTYGNVLTSISFLEGIVTERLRRRELDHHDDDYQLIVAIDAVKGV